MLRLRDHEEGRHHLRDDHARHRRAGRVDVADAARLLRRRGRHLRPTAALLQAVRWHHFRPADPGLLPDRAPGAIVCMVAMYAFTRTPLGRMCNAVRDNPERVEFIGYNPTHGALHRLLLVRASSPASRAALAAINFEIVNASYVGAAALRRACCSPPSSAASAFFFGPIIGAILVTSLQIMLSATSREVWQLYFGLMFIAVVMFAPGGIAGLLMMHCASAARARAAAGWPALSVCCSAAALIARGGRHPRDRDLATISWRKAPDGSADADVRRLSSTPPACRRGSLRRCSSSAGALLDARRLADRDAGLERRDRRGDDTGATVMIAPALELSAIRKSFGSTRDHPRRRPCRAARRAARDHRPERRRQVHAVQPHQRTARADRGRRSA